MTYSIFLLLASAIILTFIYYVIVWYFKGNDPDLKTVIPLYEPPLNLPPAAMRFLLNKYYDDKCLEAAILEAYHKGYIDLLKDKGYCFKIKLKNKSVKDQLSSPENEIFDMLWLLPEISLLISQKSHGDAWDMSALLNTAIWRKYKPYFSSNSIFLAIGVAISFIIGGFSWMQYYPSGIEGDQFVYFILGLCFISFPMTVSAYYIWKKNKKNSVIGFFILCIGLLAAMGAGGEENFGDILFAAFIFTPLVVLNLYFHHALSRYSRQGIELVSQILGYKLFLEKTYKSKFESLDHFKDALAVPDSVLSYLVALDLINSTDILNNPSLFSLEELKLIKAIK
ncbi:MAG: hypothetical protein WC752_02550 [Patescibacteria group bacterium]|jgi:hypothetical protein